MSGSVVVSQNVLLEGVMFWLTDLVLLSIVDSLHSSLCSHCQHSSMIAIIADTSVSYLVYDCSMFASALSAYSHHLREQPLSLFRPLSVAEQTAVQHCSPGAYRAIEHALFSAVLPRSDTSYARDDIVPFCRCAANVRSKCYRDSS